MREPLPNDSLQLAPCRLQPVALIPNWGTSIDTVMGFTLGMTVPAHDHSRVYPPVPQRSGERLQSPHLGHLLSGQLLHLGGHMGTAWDNC